MLDGLKSYTGEVEQKMLQLTLSLSVEPHRRRPSKSSTVGLPLFARRKLCRNESDKLVEKQGSTNFINCYERKASLDHRFLIFEHLGHWDSTKKWAFFLPILRKKTSFGELSHLSCVRSIIASTSWMYSNSTKNSGLTSSSLIPKLSSLTKLYKLWEALSDGSRQSTRLQSAVTFVGEYLLFLHAADNLTHCLAWIA